jgi:2-polyprenyl-6-methoxyphenol hydroxylase-like FAD-dependent oxidoreductase
MNKKILICIVQWFFLCALHAEHVVIVGAGPVGLATAIEAARSNCVTIVEKRNAYTRERALILDDASLSLLQSWQVSLTSCSISQLENGEKMGIIALCDLEKALKARAEALGVTFVHGEYQKRKIEAREIVVQDETKKTVKIAYDLLVGADGKKSSVREDLEISVTPIASAFGKIALLDDVKVQNSEGDPDFTPLRKENLHVMKITIKKDASHARSIICMQQQSKEEINLADLLKACGWQEEEASLQAGSVMYSDWFELPLERADCFYSQEKQAILVGDAAGSASYLRGSGVNTGFQIAHFAGVLLKMRQAHKNESQSFREFNRCVKLAVERMILDSRPLYID